MSDFKPIASNNDIKEVIRSAFDTDLDLSGAWGYSKETSTVIERNENSIPLNQLEHTLSSMRAYLEMNMTLSEEARYGSINVNELSRETIKEEGKIYHQVTYALTAMKESEYAIFIDEYKKGYGKEEFDLNDHFMRRKEKTLSRTVKHWFEVSRIA